MYIGLYYDYLTDELMYTNKTHTTLETVKYDLNYIISLFIQEKYNIGLSDEFLYIQNPLNVKINIIQTIKVNNIELIFIKNGLSIDIYSKKIQKGYIFNKVKEEHIYKFCIIQVNTNETNNENIPIFNNPTSLALLYQTKKQEPKIKSQFKYGTPLFKINEMNEMSDIESDIEENDIEEIEKHSFKENYSRDVFLDELKEKLKNRIKLKQE